MRVLGITSSAIKTFGEYDLLETALVETATPSVLFNNLDIYFGKYKHLQLKAVTKMEGSGVGNFIIRVNEDVGTNYSYHRLEGNGTSVSSASGINRSSLLMGNTQNQTNAFTMSVIDVLDFSSTSKTKTFKSFTGGHTTSYAQLGIYSSQWRSTSPITQLMCLVENGSSWSSGSRFSIYGFKG
jgi:hypothetical protein